MEWYWFLLIAVVFFGIMFAIGYAKKEDKKYKIKQFRYADGSDRKKIFDFINRHRAEHGLYPLKSDEFSTILAGVRVSELIEQDRLTDKISHKGFADDSEKLVELGADCVGENIAMWRVSSMNKYQKSTTDKVCDAWADSNGHLRNILSNRFDWVGIYIKEHNGINYYCTFFGGDDVIN